MKHVFKETQESCFSHPAWRIVARLNGIIGIEFETSDITIWYSVPDEDKPTWDAVKMGTWQYVYLPNYIMENTADKQREVVNVRKLPYSYAMAHQSIKDAISYMNHMPESEWSIDWLQRVELQLMAMWEKHRNPVRR